MVLTALAICASLVTQAGAAPDCTCRFQGRDISEGQTVCARISGQDVLMRCEKVLNNTAWTRLQDGCPQANLDADITVAADGA